MIDQYQINRFSEFCEDLNLIPLENFLNILNKNTNKFEDLEKALNLLKCINSQYKVIKSNLELLSEYIDILELLLLTVRFKILERKKEKLKLELEIAKNYRKSSDLAAISDLLKKLNKSIEDNKKRANHLEEDYNHHKNQIDQIKNTIENHNLEIKHLIDQKKMCFTQINKISRQSEDSTVLGKDEDLKKLGIKINIPNSEKIRKLQLKAKDLSFNIKQIESKKEITNAKLEKIKPKYEIYKTDYEKLLNLIKKDEEKAEELKLELKEKLEETDKDLIKEMYTTDLKTLRPLIQIDEDIKRVDKELTEITKSENFFAIKNNQDFSSIQEKLEIFYEQFTQKFNKLDINSNKKKFLKAFENYRKFELILDDLEKLLNIMLSQINLMIKFQILIDKTNTKFFINSLFKRNNKDKIRFTELTTPEKIFLIVVLYISINIVLNEKNLTFSNLFIPNDYNKGGSILRTIRKILPIFRSNENLRDFNLIFIMSNIEIKKEIKNIKVIEI
ncbi:MAG: hypothetical protein ACFFBZ_09545 [Promethearchaeota archaeon]